MADFIYPNDQPIIMLESETAFNLLAEKEKKYAHYLSRASWYGSNIGMIQTSTESPLIFILLNKLFRAESIPSLKKKALTTCGFTEDDFKAVIIYASCFFCNSGNYRCFGDVKFIPNLEKEKFIKLITNSKAAALQPEKIKNLLNKCIEKMFSLGDTEKQLDFPEKGVTTYLSKNVTKKDSEIVIEFMEKQKIEAWNTRLFKSQDETGQINYEIRVASILSNDDSEDSKFLIQHMENNHKFIVTRGDYSPILELINKNLTEAKEYAASDIEVKVLENYIQHFKTGSLVHHIEGSRLWIRNKSPAVETYFGFIESYKDPAHIRSEFEGFVAIVNKEMSKKFQTMVSSADVLLPLLPWPKSYESNIFIPPDFTSLDILTFSTIPPLGINLPNYNEITQNEGFKNVFLGNVVVARSIGLSPNFLSAEDKEIFNRLYIKEREIKVGLHEFLGHGSGKLFKREKGKFNFDETVVDLETDKKINSWYEEGQTFYSVFGDVSTSYEECRAESVAMYLSTFPEVLRLFGYEGLAAEEMMYAVWLIHCHTALEGLAHYEPKTTTWLQPHRRAFYAMLQVIVEAGDNFVTVKEVKGEDGKPDLLLTLDRSKILTVGKPAMGKFLQKLQLFRSTANASKGQSMFNKYSAVTCESHYPFLNYREIVMARKNPQQLIVQGNTVIEDGKVIFKSYESTHEGNIKAWLDRFEDNELDDLLEKLWQKDHMYFV